MSSSPASDRPFLGRTRLVFAAAAVLVAVALLWWHSRGAAGSSEPAEPPAVAVDVAPATRTNVPEYLEGVGTVQAYYTVKVTARVDGQLDKVGFVEGQTVKKGDLLAQIDPRPYQAALDQALAQRAKDLAQLGNNRRDLQRYLELAPKDLASKQTVDTQQALVAQTDAQLKADDAAIENARTQLSYTTITAPFTGRTGIRLVDPGNIVHATDTSGIVVLTQMQPIALVFTLPEDVLPQVQAALARGKVSVSALSGDDSTTYDTGTVELIDNQIDQTTGTIRVKATFPNAHLTLWPGQFVNARLLVRVAEDALTIPPEALQRSQGGFFAYVVRDDSTVEARPLKVLRNTETTVIVGSGLKAGERVVTSNFYRLAPGVRVHINGGEAVAGTAAAVAHRAS
ncbi:MAG TPA: efflux RND transporter periplasmic adaptor subunit [Steroidobacteraceae bacterium]|nr:efflux RND transporter periplasmic adaptor subunit [Steroidobacteraceae bacterium]